MSVELGLIGGTGLYAFPGLSNATRVEIDTPFGAPSGAYVCGELDGCRVAFLARHGESHTVAPHRVNYRANVHGFKQLGCRQVIGINAVGGIRHDMGPRVLVIPDQIIDYTHGRASSYSDRPDTKVEHIDFSFPYTPALRARLLTAAKQAGIAACHCVARDYESTEGEISIEEIYAHLAAATAQVPPLVRALLAMNPR